MVWLRLWCGIRQARVQSGACTNGLPMGVLAVLLAALVLLLLQRTKMQSLLMRAYQ